MAIASKTYLLPLISDDILMTLHNLLFSSLRFNSFFLYRLRIQPIFYAISVLSTSFPEYALFSNSTTPFIPGEARYHQGVPGRDMTTKDLVSQPAVIVQGLIAILYWRMISTHGSLAHRWVNYATLVDMHKEDQYCQATSLFARGNLYNICKGNN